MSEQNTRKSSLKRKASLNLTFSAKRTKKTSCKKLIDILQKNEEDRTPNERQMILDSNDSISVLKERLNKINAVKSRNDELEDEPDLLEEKCKQLAHAIQSAKHVVVYTGAGISTAAKIPDYRGTKGIWTLLQQGKDIGNHDLSLAEPTLTHMALYKLHRHGLIKHVVSQNCDDLHLRSGLPRNVLSEVHGNMSVEVCAHCEPVRYYWRIFDVTEHTARYAHQTARKCSCGEPLLDTIIHFGEKGVLLWPLNWDGANNNADKADLILCVGSSLKVLRKYGWIWGLDKPKKERPKLFIINLQWTPKDDQATLKINGKCDAVFQKVMSHLKLEIPIYDKLRDPIFYHSSHLIQQEYHTVRKPMLEIPEKEYFRNYSNCDKLLDSFRALENYQNTTVFVKEEDEINVKEEELDEEESPDVKVEPCCKEELKDEENESVVLMPGKGLSSADGHRESCDKERKIKNQETKKHERTRKPNDFLRDCTVNLTDVMIDKQSPAEIVKLFLKLKNADSGKCSPTKDVCELNHLVQENKSSFENKDFKLDNLESCIKTEQSFISSDCVGNVAKNKNSCKEDLIILEVKETSDSMKIEGNDSKSFQSVQAESHIDHPECRTEPETNGNGLEISDKVSIKSTLKNFRRAKKFEGQPSITFKNDSIQKSTVREKETTPSIINTEFTQTIGYKCVSSVTNSTTICNETQVSIPSLSNNSEARNSLESFGKRCQNEADTTESAKSDTSRFAQVPSSESSMSSLRPEISQTSSVLNSSTIPKVANTASSFSTLVASSHSKCDCRSEMDLIGSNNGTCSCGSGKSVRNPFDSSVTIEEKVDKGTLSGGKPPGSIVAIVKPLLKESTGHSNESLNQSSIYKHEPVKESSQNSISCSNISSNFNRQDNLNVNFLVANQVIGANLNNAQHVTQPILPPQMVSIFPNPNMIQSLSQSQQLLPHFQPFLPQPILHQQSLQQLLPFLMNGNLISPSNMPSPSFSLVPPFPTGIGDPPFQILTPQMPFNSFPNQTPLIYLQPLSMNSVPQQMSPNVLMYPSMPVGNIPPFPLPSTIPIQCPPVQVQPIVQANVTNMSNISLSDTYKCVQSPFDINVLSSRPILNQLPNLPLPMNLTQLPTQDNQLVALNQQFSSCLTSNVSEPIKTNVPIVDTGQPSTSIPSVTINALSTSEMSTSTKTPLFQSLSSPSQSTRDSKQAELNQATSNSSPSEETITSAISSQVPNQPRLTSIVNPTSTNQSLATEIQTFSQNLSPNFGNRSSCSPLKTPSTPPQCSPRIMNPHRSPVSPIATTLTSPLRRIRTIRPFQFKNQFSIPDDLIFCPSKDGIPSTSSNLGANASMSEGVSPSSVVNDEKSFPSEFEIPSSEVTHATGNFPSPVSNPDISSQDLTDETPGLAKQKIEDEEKPPETEVKKRGRKAKLNKEEKPAEVYHYSLPLHCEFCLYNYSSGVCLFYERQDSLNLVGRKKLYCNCCTSKKETQEISAVTSTVTNANPGWFGKGYRKNIKRKRSI